MKRLIVCIVLLAIMLAACSGNGGTGRSEYSQRPSETPNIPARLSPASEHTSVKTTQPDSVPGSSVSEPAPSQMNPPEKTPEPMHTPEEISNGDAIGEGTIRVRDGDTLERDIIPKLKKAFSLTEKQIKDALADADSPFTKAVGFRRMEGVIAPGTYELGGKSLGYWIDGWVKSAEQRLERIAAKVSEMNDLSAAQRMILASVVEGDTNIADAYEDIVATVYLNRIKKNDTFGSCPTVEYALGYQRPYLLNDDVDVDSKYNTYRRKGLPPGPICCYDDESLKASIAKPVSSKLYFFFYDYVKNEILSFTSLKEFRAAAKESKALFEQTFTISRFEKMADKREFF